MSTLGAMLVVIDERAMGASPLRGRSYLLKYFVALPKVGTCRQEHPAMSSPSSARILETCTAFPTFSFPAKNGTFRNAKRGECSIQHPESRSGQSRAGAEQEGPIEWDGMAGQQAQRWLVGVLAQ